MKFLVIAAALIDACIGDPPALPHPVRSIGGMIVTGERLLRARFPQTPSGAWVAGAVLTCSVVGITAATAWGLLQCCKRSPRYIADSLEIAMAASSLATRDLLTHVCTVEDALREDNLEAAREAVARIVGRDTATLDRTQIASAALETLAESFCDGVVAPLFFLCLGGVPLAWSYKAINTLDSMIGHREPPYTTFGSFAARCDDVANFLPARLSALAVIISAQLMGLSGQDGALCVWADAAAHLSPNAGYPEAALAGALDVRLGGQVAYQGIFVQRPILHAGGRVPTVDDIPKARALIAFSTVLFLLLSTLFARETRAYAASR